MIAGRDLGAKEERVLTGTADEVREAWSRQKKAKLECALVLNPEAREEEILHLDDEEYLRKERIPMTKDAIRALSAAKMKLHRDSVIYDIGAGTGGMTMELAMAAWQGQVYAIEKKEEAANLLKENCLRFHTDQVHVIQASAPKAMEDLPAPTHVFIGGSSGNLEEIVACALQKKSKGAPDDPCGYAGNHGSGGAGDEDPCVSDGRSGSGVGGTEPKGGAISSDEGRKSHLFGDTAESGGYWEPAAIRC